MLNITHFVNDFENSIAIASEDSNFYLEICSFPALPEETNLTVGEVDIDGNPVFTVGVAPANLQSFIAGLSNNPSIPPADLQSYLDGLTHLAVAV